MSTVFALLADLLPDVAVKGLLLLVATSCIVLFSRRASASTRHLVWLLGFAGLLLMPVLLAVLPEWRLRVLAPDVPLFEPAPAAAPIAATDTPPRLATPPIQPPAAVAQTTPQVHEPAMPPPPHTGQVPAHITSAATATTPWAVYFTTGWLIGIGLCVALWFGSRLSLWIMGKSASPASDDAWNNLLQQAQLQAGVNRGVTLRISAYASMPMTWGTRRPMIVLPVNAMDWDNDRKLAVLLHELAHIRRYDCLTQTITYLACTVHWFNPFVWLAARQARIEREHACDDAVLQTGRRASDYASHLLGVARSLRDLRLSSIGAVAMARQSQLSTRVQAILDEKIRRRAVTRKLATIGTVLAACILLPLAAAQLAARDRDRPTAIEFNPVLPWTSSGWAGSIDTDSSLYEDNGNSARFLVHEENKRHVWVWTFEQPIDFNAYPILVMKYRARNIHPQGGYVLWIDDGTGPNSGGFVAIGSNDLTTDGNEHEIRHDVRTHNPKGGLMRFALGVHAGDALPAEFELIRIAFEADPNHAPSPEVNTPQPDLSVHVQDTKGNPVAGATITLDGDRLDLRRSATTDATGNATITPHAASGIEHNLWATKEGMTITRQRKVRSADKPVLTIDEAESLSGTIINEAGQPVPFALVQCWFDTDETERMRSFSITSSVIADEQGRWRKDGLPVNANRVSLKVTHPDYTSDLAATRTPPIAALRDGSAQLILKRGNTLTGTVRDRHDNPVAGAFVGQGEDRFPTNAPPSTLTQEDGTFRFDNMPDADTTLTISAPGSGPTQLIIRKADLNKPLEITLSQPHVMRVRVIDSQGNPIPDARITSDTWRGNRALIWTSGLDADGRTTWNEAPADEVLYDIYASDYMSVRQVPLKVNTTEENVVTLPDTLRISGTVTDAETGEPIPLFTIQRGIASSLQAPSSVSWNLREDTRGYDGTYEATATYPYRGHVLRIVADGYRPATSPAFASDAGTVTHDFKLTKQSLRTGIIRTPDGQPASGATAAVCNLLMRPAIHDSKNFYPQPSPSDIATANADGTFTFPEPEDAQNAILVLLHDAGWLEVPFSIITQTPEFQLEAWGRIVGQSRKGTAPDTAVIFATNERLYSELEPARITWNYTATPDSAGQFTIERVKPDQVDISKNVQLAEQYSARSYHVRKDVAAGQAVEVSIGGAGRAVVGQVKLPDDIPEWIAPLAALRPSLQTGESIPWPVEWKNMAIEQKRQWWQTWISTADGIQWNEQEREPVYGYAVALARDGTFRVDDVAPGTYQLHIALYRIDSFPANMTKETLIGKASFRNIVIPEIPGGRSDEPLDVGEVPFKLAEPTTQPAS